MNRAIGQHLSSMGSWRYAESVPRKAVNRVNNLTMPVFKDERNAFQFVTITLVKEYQGEKSVQSIILQCSKVYIASYGIQLPVATFTTKQV